MWSIQTSLLYTEEKGWPQLVSEDKGRLLSS